jgi:PadR family transcriptional regulator PadR
LIRAIKAAAELDISEGMIYPLLNRLKNEALISSRWEERDSGLPRKYYGFTEKGRSAAESEESSR